MFEKEIKLLKDQGMLRKLISRSSAQGPLIRINRREYINFSSNDYLGLAAHPSLIRAAEQAMQKYGFGAGASRLLAGGTTIHETLENEIAAWKQSDAALLFNTGYAANTGIIPAIASDGDIIFSDELNHASIIDGCRLSRAKTVIYRHRDMADLKMLLKKEKGRRKIVVTDTVFSMDGDIALLRDLYRLCCSDNSSLIANNRLLLYLDDAHATGVLGKGRGALAHFGIKPEKWVIQMGTFSKALGSFGAYAASSRDIIDWISNSARSLIFSTAVPPAVAASSLAALHIIKKDRKAINNLWKNKAILEDELNSLGYEIRSDTPIMPLLVSTAAEAVRISGHLLSEGIYVPAIRPPTVKQPRLRIVVTAAHEQMHIRKLVAALKKWGRRRAVL